MHPIHKAKIVAVAAGTKFGAGTNSRVFLVVHGSQGDTVEQQLENPKIKNPFERGQSDAFSLDDQFDIGVIQKITIRIDGRGMGADWFMDKVRSPRHLECIVDYFLRPADCPVPLSCSTTEAHADIAHCLPRINSKHLTVIPLLSTLHQHDVDTL